MVARRLGRPLITPANAVTPPNPFFTSDSGASLPPAWSHAGNVPEVFCNNPIILCVTAPRPSDTDKCKWDNARSLLGIRTSCFFEAHTSPPEASQFRVIFTISVAGNEPFHPITNSLRVESGAVVGKAVMQPLGSVGSQYVARTTTISADIFCGSRLIASARSLLSFILWGDSRVVGDALSKRRLSWHSSRRMRGSEERNLVRGRGCTAARLHAEASHLADDRVDFDLSATMALSLDIAMRGVPLVLEIARADDVEGNLIWQTLHKSKLWPDGSDDALFRFPSELFEQALGLDRPLRFYLQAYECAMYSKKLGFCETTMTELLAQQRFCPQRMDFVNHSFAIPIALEVQSVVEYPGGVTELCLSFLLSP